MCRFYNLAFYQTDSIGAMDADIMIQLKEKHRPTAMYEDSIRHDLAREFPGVTTYFQAADIIAQVFELQNFSSAIDVQVSGNDLDSDYAIARRLEKQMRNIPGVADLRIAEPLDLSGLQRSTSIGTRRSNWGSPKIRLHQAYSPR